MRHLVRLALCVCLLPGLTEAQAASQPGVVLEEFVFETAPFPSCHAATILELPDGELLCAFFGGTRERHPDVEIRLSRKPVGGAWSAPVSVADGVLSADERLPTWNPVLFQPDDGDVMLFYKVGPSPAEWWGMVKTSADGGRTWSVARRLGEGLIGPVKNKPIRLGDGVVVAGSSTEDDGWRVHVERSTDDGRTWNRIGPLNPDAEIGAIQPTLLTYADGRIQMLCRTRSGHGFIAQGWSGDGGLTWSPLEATVLPNNNSGIDGVTLADGRQLLVYNHSTRTQPGMGHKGRGVLNVALSRDGIDWEAALVLDHLDESGRQFSYPAVIQTGDGLVHVVYTWHRERIKHVVLDPARLQSVPMPGGAWPAEGPVSLEAFHEARPAGSLGGDRHRLLVSTDIGGTDPDDFQSMVHLLLYSDVLDIEGLISSPYGPGRADDILKVIDCYACDYTNLKTHSDDYPAPEALRSIVKQGETEAAPYAGFRRPTEGSEWIIECARRDDPRPLHVLVWGGIEDLAQALHDAPDILPGLRVYWIGGPNKKWSPDACQYIVAHHPGLWIIESNATYRGWFVGGDQSGEWGNEEFVTRHVAGHGALGTFFASRRNSIKMGDTPSVGWLLRGTPGDPSLPGWGGRYVRAWERPFVRFDRMPTAADRMEIFGIMELALPLGGNAPSHPEAVLDVGNQKLAGHAPGDGTLRFRFCPKSAGRFDFRIRGNVPMLDGTSGGITVVPPSPGVAGHPSARLPNWWTDDPSPESAEGPHDGAKTVSRWRADFLSDFAARMDRCTNK